MTVSDLAKGLAIIQPHDPDGEIAVEHDVIYVSEVSAIPEESPAGIELAALGWRCDGEAESWEHFT